MWGAQTRWGTSTLTVAFKLLLKEALTEPSNQRFVLLDESAVPLYPAAAVYLQLMGESKSRVAACVVRPASLNSPFPLPCRGSRPEFTQWPVRQYLQDLLPAAAG